MEIKSIHNHWVSLLGDWKATLDWSTFANPKYENIYSFVKKVFVSLYVRKLLKFEMIYKYILKYFVDFFSQTSFISKVRDITAAKNSSAGSRMVPYIITTRARDGLP